MSLQDVKVKLETGLNDIYTALEEKSATIPEQKNLINVAPAIRSITGGSGDNSGEYVWSKYSDYVKGEEIPYNTKLLMHLNDNLEDESGINTPKLYGTAQYDTGKFDKAFKGDGASCIAIPNNESIKFGTKDFTISCWYYWDGSHVSGEWPCVLSQRYRYNSSYTEAGFQIFMNASTKKLIWKVMKSYNTDLVSNVETTKSIPVNEWFHLAMIRKGTSMMLFLNGEIVASATISASDPVYQHDNAELKIGAANINSSQSNTPVNHFICKVDEFIIVNGTALWDSNFTPPTLPYGDTGTFEEYVVSNDENAYPNNDYGEDGFYYMQGFNEDTSDIPTITTLEYIESTGDQYIDTGIIPTSKTKWVYDYQFMSASSIENNAPQNGCGITDDTKRFVVTHYNNLLISIGVNGTGSATGDLNRHTFILDALNKKGYVDDIEISCPYTSFSGAETICFFTRKTDGNVSAYRHAGRLYSSKIYENNVLVRDFVPTLLNGEACLYDKVTGYYFINQGTGSFNAGPIVE